jgi:hypothetical protein
VVATSSGACKVSPRIGCLASMDHSVKLEIKLKLPSSRKTLNFFSSSVIHDEKAGKTMTSVTRNNLKNHSNEASNKGC